MEYKKDRFLTQEQLDIEAFKIYAELCPKNYAITAETPYGTIADVISQNNTGGTILTELKARKSNALEYEDIFIEVSKWSNLMKIWRYKGILPVYVNFFEDCKDMYVWILPQIKEVIFHPNVIIYGTEEVDRIGLPWKAAYHIKFNEQTNDYSIIKPDTKYVKALNKKPQYYDSSILNNCTNKKLFNL